MREIFFNSFKEKILRGDVPAEFELSGAPVTSKFFDAYDNSDITIEQYRNLADFDTYHSGNSATIPALADTLFEYSSYGVEYRSYEPDDLSEKPMFVNSANSAEFFKIYSFDLMPSTVQFAMDTFSDSAGANYNYGFYYAMKKSHLNWLAKRCNDEWDFNNQIRIVLGDDIGNLNDQDTLESMFCPTPDRPFQGVFDMNGHKIINKALLCKNDSNGLFGYLGKNGIVRNGIVENISMICQNRITLDKIRDNCSDVVCGFLVGTNYGTVENIVTSGTMQFDGFCPDTYLVNNKYDYEEGDTTFANSAYNCFFPNKFCINSVYNVLPYVGYFCEGADSFYNDAGNPSTIDLYAYTSKIVQNNSLVSLGYLTRTGFSEFNQLQMNLNHFFEGKCAINDSFDQTWIKPSDAIPYVSHIERAYIREAAVQVDGLNYLDWVYGYVLKNVVGDELFGGLPNFASMAPLIGTESNVPLLDKMSRNTIESLKKWTSFDGVEEYEIKTIGNYGKGYININRASYLCRQIRDTLMTLNAVHERVTPHQRMNPNARIAYYCSPIVGNNFGTIQHIDCKHVIRESNDTFVGFIGNVCGKQNCGNISVVNTTLDIESNSACELNHKTYTKQKKYSPDYPDDWGNLYSVFGYNWDYCQSPYGVDAEEYSANSADCVRVTESYYDFHDFVYSGVSPTAFSRYTFNRYANKDQDYGNCNFAVNSSATSATIGSTIPDPIRNAKMKVKFTHEQTPDGFYIGFDVSSPGYYGRVKLHDPYNELNRSNVESPLNMTSAQLVELASYIECDVQHFDLNYLGDAAKTLFRTDIVGGINQDNETANGEKYPLSLDEVLLYSSAFNGECGRTLDNAPLFCRNIMNAKIAMGAELLANSAVNAMAYYPWQDKPFRDGNWSPFGTLNCYDPQWDTRWYDNKNRIYPGEGPNNSNNIWFIYEDNNDNGPDMCWYMPPASRDYTVGQWSISEDERGEDGPMAYSTEVLGDPSSTNINAKQNNMNWFCSIHPEGKWDLVANAADYKGQSPTIHRSVVTIEPRQSDASMEGAKSVIALLSSTGIFADFDLSGEWDARFDDIRIPLMNRTQNKSFQSSTFEGVSNVSGVYLQAERGTDGWKIQNGQIESQHDAMLSDIGNLESMYVTISILKTVNGRKRVYPVTLELPLSNLYIPISCISAGQAQSETCTGCTHDLANWQIIDPPMPTTVRDVSYYPLVPAYDVEATNGELVDYQLKSIYNIGAVAGMINHSERHIQNGDHQKILYDEEGHQYAGSYNIATCGRIDNVMASYTDRAMEFIASTMTCPEDAPSSGCINPENDRTIAVANKFSLMAPVYEYHQNELGTSFEVEDFYTDALQRIAGNAQVTRFVNIVFAGTERWPLSQSTSKSFNPFIEWCNISNVLDYTNFFEKRVYTNADDKTFYIPYQDSNYPEMLQILWDASSMTGEDIPIDQVLYGGAGTGMLKSDWPVYRRDRYTPPDGTPYGSMVKLEDLSMLTSEVRKGFTKHYEYLPNYLLSLYDVIFADTGTTRLRPELVSMHMSPAADFPSSDYNDIFGQLLSGSPNFVFSRLCKPIRLAQIDNHEIRDEILQPTSSVQEFYDTFVPFNSSMMSFYQQRLSGHAADRYFTWDYDLSLIENYPLLFHVIYDRAENGDRGLWMHQNIDAVDAQDSIVHYSMRGESGCFNDGSNVALGYMPSEESLVQIMNTLERDLFDEGVAIAGKDFQGIVLFDSNKDLVVAFDSQNGRDVDNEAVVFELPRKILRNDRAYGLLTKIEAE